MNSIPSKYLIPEGRLTINRTIKILLADMNPGSPTLIEEIFNEAGFQYNLHSVRNISEAVSYLCRGNEYTGAEIPDLILLESGLLYNDSDIWIENIRSSDRFKDIPTVALLLFHEEEEHFRSRGLPVDCYLERPVDLFETGSIIRTLKKFVAGHLLLNSSIVT